jgi:aldehyde:ferredoxin oxidoreductase
LERRHNITDCDVVVYIGLPFQSGPEVYTKKQTNGREALAKGILVKANKPIYKRRVTCAYCAVACQRDSTHYFWLEIFGTKGGGLRKKNVHTTNETGILNHHHELMYYCQTLKGKQQLKKKVINMKDHVDLFCWCGTRHIFVSQ